MGIDGQRLAVRAEATRRAALAVEWSAGTVQERARPDGILRAGEIESRRTSSALRRLMPAP